MNKELTWQDAYKLPLKRFHSKVMTSEFSMAFDFPFDLMAGMFNNPVFPLSDSNQDLIVGKLNGNDASISFTDLKYKKDGTITTKGDVLLLIRGWGHLTGFGAMKLNPELAAKLQDDFANYIIQKLS